MCYDLCGNTKIRLSLRNEIFATLNKVVERLCDTVCSLKRSDIQSITARKWIIECFS